MKPHRNLEVWQKSMELVRQIYKLTDKLPSEERYGLISQMRRCAVSIPSNIAEGVARQGQKEAIQFLSIAMASLSELDTQLELCLQLEYIIKEQASELLKLMEKVDVLLNGLLSYRRKLLPNIAIYLSTFLPFYLSIRRLVFLSTFLPFYLSIRRLVFLSTFLPFYLSIRRLVFLSTFLPFYLSTCLYSAFDELNIGARPQGMGGAFTAVNDDANSLFYNPAGISYLKKSEFTSNYGQLFVGLDDNSSISSSFVGYAHPINKYGTAGISWYNLSLSQMYSETATSFSYAYPFGKISAGLTVKNVSVSFGSDQYTRTAVNVSGDETRLEKEGVSGDPVFDNSKKSSAITGDVGVHYAYSKNIAIAISAKNITRPDIGLFNTDKLFAVYRCGIAYKGDDHIVSLEAVNKGYDLNILTGAEKRFIKKNIAIRGGLSLGNRRYRTISIGSSLRFDNFSFDYAFLWPISGIKDTLGTHKIAFNIKFGKQRISREEENLLKEKQSKLEAERESKRLLLEAEKFRNEAEKIKQESELQLKDVQKAQEESRKLQKISSVKDSQMEEMRKKDDIEKTFMDSMIDYQKQVSIGIEIPERLLILDKIAKKYENSNVDMTDLTVEKETVLRTQRAIKSDYESSMNYYKRLKERGAMLEEKRSLLTKIIGKYRIKGIDVSEAERELFSLR